VAPLFKYNDLNDRNSDVVEFTRSAAQQIVDQSILPAARRIDRLRPSTVQAVKVFVRDIDSAAIEAPRWSPGAGVDPAVVMKFGLNYSIQQHAHVALQFDRLLALPNDASPETVSDSLSKYMNTYLAVYLSSRQSRVDGRQFFDRGLFDAAQPVNWTADEHFRYRTHILKILTVLLAHEVCHHILGHTSSPDGDRRLQEMEADVCAADIFVENLSPSATENPLRLFGFLEAAQLISLASMINWPVTASDEYPTPDERYQAIMASIADDLLEAETGLAEYIRAQLPFTVPLSVLSNPDLMLPIIAIGVSGESQIYDLLTDAYYPIREATDAAQCDIHQPDQEFSTYFCSRLAVDKAAILTELILMRGTAALEDFQVIDASVELAELSLESFSFPVTSSDLARLRSDVTLAKSVPTFSGNPPSD
jgi:hypothetical protein